MKTSPRAVGRPASSVVALAFNSAIRLRKLRLSDFGVTKGNIMPVAAFPARQFPNAAVCRVTRSKLVVARTNDVEPQHETRPYRQPRRDRASALLIAAFGADSQASERDDRQLYGAAGSRPE